jgi:hypothetical protein
MRVALAVALTFAIAAAVPQSASAASKSHHHPAKTSPTKKPSEQYLRSASPDPEHAQRWGRAASAPTLSRFAD